MTNHEAENSVALPHSVNINNDVTLNNKPINQSDVIVNNMNEINPSMVQNDFSPNPTSSRSPSVSNPSTPSNISSMFTPAKPQFLAQNMSVSENDIQETTAKAVFDLTSPSSSDSVVSSDFPDTTGLTFHRPTSPSDAAPSNQTNELSINKTPVKLNHSNITSQQQHKQRNRSDTSINQPSKPAQYGSTDHSNEYGLENRYQNGTRFTTDVPSFILGVRNAPAIKGRKRTNRAINPESLAIRTNRNPPIVSYHDGQRHQQENNIGFHHQNRRTTSTGILRHASQPVYYGNAAEMASSGGGDGGGGDDDDNNDNCNDLNENGNNQNNFNNNSNIGGNNQGENGEGDDSNEEEDDSNEAEEEEEEEDDDSNEEEGDDDDDDDDDDDEHDEHDLVTGSLLPRSRVDFDPGRFQGRESSRFRERDNAMRDRRDRLILGCGISVVTLIVFVIIVSGVTTMLTDTNFPQLEIYSSWPDHGRIPMKYGCFASPSGPSSSVSFPLKWRNVPRSATNLVILFANAGAISQQTYNDPVHWLVTDIPVNTGVDENGIITDGLLPENASRDSSLMPDSAIQHPNVYSRKGFYWPPCSKQNESSLFVIHAYAIDAKASIDSYRDAREVMNRFVGVPVAKLTGFYGNDIDEL